ncbi:hypothetical protein IP91_04549 [Pseudoduganella lurida]|uniref:Uncharacterized protein n=1 Tax=Pseudoduganella lurida TaxID=1036180 RepID=A0A562QXC4_9BURK|nr:hypothetical protein IP91_04549 [Pseudoduganella lurida]
MKPAWWWIATALVLALVFAAYLRPDFMFDMATRIVLCFQ